QERHGRGELDAEDRRGDRPIGIAVAERAITGEESAEAHGVAGEEVPHAELPPALGGERRFGRLDQMRVHGCGAHGVTSLGPSAGPCRRRRDNGTMMPRRPAMLRRYMNTMRSEER